MIVVPLLVVVGVLDGRVGVVVGRVVVGLGVVGLGAGITFTQATTSYLLPFGPARVIVRFGCAASHFSTVGFAGAGAGSRVPTNAPVDTTANATPEAMT